MKRLSTGAAVIVLVVTACRLGAQTGAVLPTAAAFPRTYSGNCPRSIEFIGHILVTVPGTQVDYQWERSNGTKGKVLHAQIGKPLVPGAPRDTMKSPNITEPVVSDKWYVGLPQEGGRFWEKLHILAPFDIYSPPALVDVECR